MIECQIHKKPVSECECFVKIAAAVPPVHPSWREPRDSFCWYCRQALPSKDLSWLDEPTTWWRVLCWQAVIGVGVLVFYLMFWGAQ
jgi:hypothetical protein